MGKLIKLNKKNAKMFQLKSLLELSIGDHIGLPVGEHKVFAEVVGLPHPHKPLIVYRILGTESIGVVNLKRSQVFKINEDISSWALDDIRSKKDDIDDDWYLIFFL